MEENTKLESSIKVLLILFVNLEQNFEALIFYSDNIAEDSIDRNETSIPNKSETIDSTIIDALWFQITIKSCSFLDEWDKFLGVKNEPTLVPKLKLIKSIVKPARKAINTWTELKEFRNEIVAHNFRKKKEQLVMIDQMGDYDCPQTIGEMYFLICFIDRMIRVLTKNFPKEVEVVIEQARLATLKPANDIGDKLKELNEKLISIDEAISKEIFAIHKYDFLKGLSDSLNDQ